LKDLSIDALSGKRIAIHSHIVMTKGFSKSILLDHRNSTWFDINHETHDIICECQTSIDDCLNKRSIIDKKFIIEYIDVLILNNIFFLVDEKIIFESFESRNKLSDFDQLILVIGENSTFDINKALYEINNYSFNCILIDLDGVAIPDINSIKNVYLILRSDFKKFIFSHLEFASTIFSEIHFYNSPNEEVLMVNYCKIIYYQNGNANVTCGQISEYWFNVDSNVYSNRKYNSCLQGKVTIDAEGNIKNCPSMKESYGNIKDTTLAEAIEKPGFKKYWDINKDKIHVCKDCEFRYICTDCRAYIEDPEDILSKPLKCGYNPYTGEWSEWSTNPLKQKAIDFYGMREMVEEMDVSDSDAT